MDSFCPSPREVTCPAGFMKSVELSCSSCIVKSLLMIAENSGKAAAATSGPTRTCPECLSEIPLAAGRCRHCGGSAPIAGLTQKLGGEVDRE